MTVFVGGGQYMGPLPKILTFGLMVSLQRGVLTSQSESATQEFESAIVTSLFWSAAGSRGWGRRGRISLTKLSNRQVTIPQAESGPDGTWKEMDSGADGGVFRPRNKFLWTPAFAVRYAGSQQGSGCFG